MKVPMTLLACLALVAACGGDSSGPSPAKSVAYSGTFASGINSGIIRFNSAPAATVQGAALSAPIDLIGILVFSTGDTLVLAGNLNGAALTLNATGYQFTGTLSGGIISGTFTGPNGESGNFAATLDSPDASVVLYCGNFSGTDNGVFSLALAPDRTGGVIVVPSGSSGGLTGDARPKAGTSNQVEVLPDAAPTQVIATGTIAAIGTTGFDSIFGNWNTGTDNGSFGGSNRCN